MFNFFKKKQKSVRKWEAGDNVEWVKVYSGLYRLKDPEGFVSGRVEFKDGVWKVTKKDNKEYEGPEVYEYCEFAMRACAPNVPVPVLPMWDRVSDTAYEVCVYGNGETTRLHRVERNGDFWYIILKRGKKYEGTEFYKNSENAMRECAPELFTYKEAQQKEVKASRLGVGWSEGVCGESYYVSYSRLGGGILIHRIERDGDIWHITQKGGKRYLGTETYSSYQDAMLACEPELPVPKKSVSAG